MRTKKSFILLTLLLLLTGCNLFIDDEEMNAGNQDVPVHEGEGYDAPVTVEDGGCTVTYQFNSEVRQLTLSDQRYIVKAETDPTGAFIEIHYRPDTPADLLPVPGEIIVSTVTDIFPWGCNHRVKYRVDEDGVIKYIATFAQLEETYKELDIQGKMTTQEYEDFYVDAVIEEDIPASDSTQATTRSTLVRQQASADSNKGVHVSFEGGKVSFTIPFGNNLSIEGSSGNLEGSFGISFPDGENYYKSEFIFDFENFSISDKQFQVKVQQTVEQSVVIKVEGKGSISKAKTWRPIKGKAFTMGPVVIVLFININLEVAANIDVSASFSSYKKYVNHYDIDLLNFKLTKTVDNIKDTGWQFPEFIIEGNISLALEFQLGLGIYGKILSVRIIPSLILSFGAQTPRYVTMANGHKAFDLTTRAGPKWKLEVGLKLGVYLDLSLSNILDAYESLGEEAQKRMLKDLEDEARQSSEYYEQLAKGDYSNYDPNRKDRYGYKDGEGDEASLTTTFGPWLLWNKDYSWYPRIDDNSLRVNKIWDASTESMRFVGEYKVADAGIMAKLFNNWLIPGLCVCDKDQVSYIYSTENSNVVRLEEGKVYHFDIPARNEETTNSIAPCYYDLAQSTQRPVAIDKSLKINVTSPSASLFSVVPTDCTREAFSFPDQNKGFRYKWTFSFYTVVKVKGFDNMDSFGVKEMMGASHQYSPRTDSDRRDGTYRLNWQAVHRSDNSTDAGILLSLQAFYVVNGQVMNDNTQMTLSMNSDRTYTVNDGTFEMPGTYSRRLSSWNSNEGDVEFVFMGID